MRKFINKIKKLSEFEYNSFYPFIFTIIFILILIQYPFHSIDSVFYDLWVRWDKMSESSSSIVTVVLDEESDQFLGEIYPYTYSSHNKFIKNIIKDNPSVVGYLLPFYEPEELLERKNLEIFKEQVLKFQNSGGKFRFGTDRDAWGEQVPPKELGGLGYSLGIIHKDGNVFSRDEITRRCILNISGEDSFHLWVANSYLQAKGDEMKEPSSFHGSYYDILTDATFVPFKYSSDPQSKEAIREIAFHQVVVGNYPKNFFKDKIVLVGSRYISNSGDFLRTPFSKEEATSPKINVHAQIISSLIMDNTVLELASWVSSMIALLIAIILSFIVSRVHPSKGLLLTIGILFLIFLSTFLLFSSLGIWLKISHVILSVFVVYYIWVPFRAIDEYQTRYAIEEESKILKKVDNLKQNFISLMSHDLKTPVAKISGIADILKNQYDNSQKQDELLENIANSTTELNSFINSILDLTKIESSSLSLNLESKDVNTLIESTVDSLKFEANNKKMRITKNLEPLYPIYIDSNLINRVLQNLIGNAIKYAGEGKDITISSWDDEEWVYIETSDNGKGIEESDLENIFEKFYRVKDDESHKIKGSGLGLYLVKYFVELHKGEITVESKIGHGTRFLVKLKNA